MSDDRAREAEPQHARDSRPETIEPGQIAHAEATRAARAGARVLREIMSAATPCISVLAVVLALVVGAHPDRPHRRGRAGGSRLLLLPARRHLRGDLERRSPARTSSLFQGSIYNFRRAGLRRRHQAAHRDADLRHAADRGRPRRRARASASALFNIGGRGQMLIAAAAAGWVGFSFDLPPGIHLLVAVIAGIVGGALWGGIVGLLKARTGAHEVIVTIMLNYVAFYLVALPAAHPGAAAGAGLEQPEDAADAAERRSSRRCSGRSTTCTSGFILVDRRDDLRLVAAQPLEPRLPVPRGRREPERRAGRRHQRQERLRLRDAHLRCARRPRRRQPGARHRHHRLHARASTRASASTRSPSPCSAARGRGACSSPASCSARSRPAASRCRPPRASRSTSCWSCSRSSCCSSRRRRWCAPIFRLPDAAATPSRDDRDRIVTKEVVTK